MEQLGKHGGWGRGLIQQGTCGRKISSDLQIRELKLNAEVKKWLGQNSKLKEAIQKIKGNTLCTTPWKDAWKLDDILGNGNTEDKERSQIVEIVHGLQDTMKEIFKDIGKQAEQTIQKREQAKKANLGKAGHLGAEGNKLERRRRDEHTHDNYRPFRTNDGKNGHAATTAANTPPGEPPAEEANKKKGVAKASTSGGDKDKIKDKGKQSGNQATITGTEAPAPPAEKTPSRAADGSDKAGAAGPTTQVTGTVRSETGPAGPVPQPPPAAPPKATGAEDKGTKSPPPPEPARPAAGEGEPSKDSKETGKCSKGTETYTVKNAGAGVHGSTSSTSVSFGTTSDIDSTCGKKPEDSGPRSLLSNDATENSPRPAVAAPAAPAPPAPAQGSSGSSTSSGSAGGPSAGSAQGAGGGGSSPSSSPSSSSSSATGAADGNQTNSGSQGDFSGLSLDDPGIFTGRNPGAGFAPPTLTEDKSRPPLNSKDAEKGDYAVPDLTADVLIATTPVLFFLASVIVAILGYSLWKRTIIELHLAVLNECEAPDWENVKEDYLQILVQEFAHDLEPHANEYSSTSDAPSTNEGLSGNNVSSTVDPPTDFDGKDPCLPPDPDPWSCMETTQLATDPCAPHDCDPWSCMENIQLATDPCPPTEDPPDPWSCMETIPLQTDPCPPNDCASCSCMESIQLDAQQNAHFNPEHATSDCTHWINWIDRNKYFLRECTTQPWFLQLKADWKQHVRDHMAANVEHGHSALGEAATPPMQKLDLWKQWIAQQHRHMSTYSQEEWFKHLLHNVEEETVPQHGQAPIVHNDLEVEKVMAAQQMLRVRAVPRSQPLHPQPYMKKPLTAKIWILLLALVIEHCEVERSLQDKELYVDALLQKC
ncbi:hypothetical protein AK88_05421 [Plasmodium fragile]|uniref:Uncharacterized protein n=1 Tax=Plasmodium fragile TaxID=5857 RepID=A0A0D9QD51_PLAFR|nr:uncharacterized protein AK88_05421 [Plasmodium fragile]KJP84943.1 hypothetical protein AK88_05421 [Plasmodium fragile]